MDNSAVHSIRVCIQLEFTNAWAHDFVWKARSLAGPNLATSTFTQLTQQVAASYPWSNSAPLQAIRLQNLCSFAQGFSGDSPAGIETNV
eukprot:1162025-Pelagomonas_calceolata.AAC.8